MDPVPPSPTTSDTAQESMEFLAKKNVGREATLFLVGGVLGTLLCLGLFLLTLLLPPRGGIMPGLIGAMMAGSLFMILRAVILLRSPCRVVLDASGVFIERRIARTFVPWSQIATLRRERTSDLFGRGQKDVLVLCGEDGRVLARIVGSLVNFPVLVAEIESRSAAARGAPTYDRDRAIQERRRKAKRSARLAVGGGIAIGLIGIAVAGDGVNTTIHERALAREGQDVQARVARHYVYNVTPHLEYDFQDARGQEHRRDVVLESPAWEALRDAQTVEVRYLPSNPNWSVVAGEEKMTMEGVPSVVLGLAVALLAGAMISAIALGYTDIRMEGGKIRFQRIQDLDDALVSQLLEAVAAPGPPVAVPEACSIHPLQRTTGPPRGVRTLGILSIVFGVLGMASNAVKLGFVLSVQQMSWATEDIELTVESTFWPRIEHGVNLGLATVLLLSGIGLLVRRRWGRKLALGAAAGQVLMGLVGIGLIVTGFAQSLGQFPPERRIYVIVPFVGALIVEVLGLVYPSVLLVLLGRRTMGKTLGPAEPGGPPVDS